MQLFFILIYSLVVHAQVDVLVENGTEVAPSESIGRSIALMKAPRHSCTASFISEITLLTAGHCIKGDLPSSVRIQIRDARGQVYQEVAKALIRHPGYTNEPTPEGGNIVSNDYGLIKLKRRMGTQVRPLRIVDPRSQTGFIPVVVLGYGKVSKTKSSTVLRRGKMTASIQPIEAFHGVEGLFMVAADSRSNATCPGDSGGPVIYDDAGKRSLIGVHSLSSGCQGGGNAQSLSALPVQVSSWIWANYE